MTREGDVHRRVRTGKEMVGSAINMLASAQGTDRYVDDLRSVYHEIDPDAWDECSGCGKERRIVQGGCCAECMEDALNGGVF